MGRYIKRSLIIVAGFVILITVACGESAIKFERGHLVEGTVTSSDSIADGWRSKPYITEIFEDIEYFIRLSSPTGAPVGLWNPVADEFIIELNSGKMTRTVAYVFSEGDFQELFVRSPDSEVPTPFTFMFWIRGS